MPRAFCPECGTEVPVDPDGVCHVGHVIDLDTANVRDDEIAAPLSGTPSQDTDEPEPWVASVDTTTLGGYTPPPDAQHAAPQPPPPAPADRVDDQAQDLTGLSGAADLPLPPSSPASPPPAASAAPEPPAYEPQDDGLDVTPGIFDIGGGDDAYELGGSDDAYDLGDGDEVHDLGGGDDLAAAANAAAASLGASSDQDEVLGWEPPTTSPIGGPPVPPPAPVDRPDAPVGGETLTGDFDLDDLEAAVSELSSDAPAAGGDTPPPPTAAPAPAPADDDEDLDLLSAFGDDEDDATPPPPTSPPAPPSGAPADLPPPSAAPVPADETPAPPPPPSSDDEVRAPEHRFPRPASADAPASNGDAASEPEEVDLSNFTAKGSGGSKRGGFFKRR